MNSHLSLQLDCENRYIYFHCKSEVVDRDASYSWSGIDDDGDDWSVEYLSTLLLVAVVRKRRDMTLERLISQEYPWSMDYNYMSIVAVPIVLCGCVLWLVLDDVETGANVTTPSCLNIKCQRYSNNGRA